MAQARKELSIQKRPRLTEAEKEAIDCAFEHLCDYPNDERDHTIDIAIKILRRMLEE